MTHRISWLRVGLITSGALAMFPLSLMFGVYGFGAAAVFIVLAALAR